MDTAKPPVVDSASKEAEKDKTVSSPKEASKQTTASASVSANDNKAVEASDSEGEDSEDRATTTLMSLIDSILPHAQALPEGILVAAVQAQNAAINAKEKRKAGLIEQVKLKFDLDETGMKRLSRQPVSALELMLKANPKKDTSTPNFDNDSAPKKQKSDTFATGKEAADSRAAADSGKKPLLSVKGATGSGSGSSASAGQETSGSEDTDADASVSQRQLLDQMKNFQNFLTKMKR